MKRCFLFAVIAVILAPSLAWATPLHYWRFEDSPGFLEDSAGSATLVGTAATQVSVPGVGPGSHFADLPFANTKTASIAGNDASTFALGTTVAPTTGDFTVEALVHFTSFGSAPDVMVGNYSGPNAATISWLFHVRHDNFAGSLDRELLLITSDGSSFETMKSGIVLDAGIDYYLAAAFDLSGGQATFFVQDLTNAGALQTVIAGHGATSLNSQTSLYLGGASPPNSYPHTGLLDEVRISDTALSAPELLLNIPEPSTALLLGTSLLGLGLLRRRGVRVH